MNFRQLEVFRAVAQARSFTRAAHALLISQSTVSQHIRELEDSLGCTLFERSRRNVALSAAGGRLLEHCHRIFRLLEEAESEVQTERNPYSGPLAFGCASSTLLYRLPPVLTEYTRKYPEVDLRITDGTIQEVAGQLWAGALDLALVVLPLAAPGLRKIVLCEEPFVLVLPARHKLLRAAKVSIRDAAGERFILHRRGQNTRKLIDRFLYKRKITPRICIEVAEAEAIKEMVARGLGVSILPASALEGGGALRGIRGIPLGGADLRRTLALVYLRPQALRPPALALVEMLKEHFQAEPAIVKADLSPRQ